MDSPCHVEYVVCRESHGTLPFEFTHLKLVHLESGSKP